MPSCKQTVYIRYEFVVLVINLTDVIDKIKLKYELTISPWRMRCVDLIACENFDQRMELRAGVVYEAFIFL